MRRAFSFTEILFAVMILGIGFIMIAAVFPVAIKQTAQTGEESIGASIAREATATLTSLNTSLLMPPTVPQTIPIGAVPGNRAIGQVWSFHDLPQSGLAVPRGGAYNWTTSPPTAANVQAEAMWNAIRGNLILPFNPQYAWVAMYRRDGTWTGSGSVVSGVIADPFAQIIIIGVQVRNRSAYDPNLDLQRNPPVGGPEPATLEPKLLTINMDPQGPGQGPAHVTFVDPPREPDRTAEGAFLVISDDNLANSIVPRLVPLAGQYNGHIYRLGALRRDVMATAPNSPPIYELAPGYDADPIFLRNASAFVVGRGYASPPDPGPSSKVTFDGIAQDVCVYTTYMRVN